MNRMAGKVIVVTGGTQGLGEAVARQAAREGAAGLVTCGRQTERGQAIAAELSEAGCPCEFVRADLASVDDCRQIMHHCDEVFGRVDGLVNAAADTRRGTLDDTSVEFWDHQFAVNARAPFIITQECVRIMKRERIAGSVVNVLSVAAYCGLPILCSYSATKGALATFTKNIANALRRDRIRVNGIHLGWMDSPNEHVVQAAQGAPADWLEKAEAESAFGRILKPEDVAELCIYLLSDTSGILTGSNIDYAHRVMGVFPPETE